MTVPAQRVMVIMKQILDEKQGLAACQPKIALADSPSSCRRHILDDTHKQAPRGLRQQQPSDGTFTERNVPSWAQKNGTKIPEVKR